jgi:hypothetical protein
VVWLGFLTTAGKGWERGLPARFSADLCGLEARAPGALGQLPRVGEKSGLRPPRPQHRFVRAAFAEPSGQIGGSFKGVGALLWKSGDHIQNFVGVACGIASTLYLVENMSFICIAIIRILESNLLMPSSGSLNGSGQVLALR